jgi:hypothetical protein
MGVFSMLARGGTGQGFTPKQMDLPMQNGLAKMQSFNLDKLIRH